MGKKGKKECSLHYLFLFPTFSFLFFFLQPCSLLQGLSRDCDQIKKENSKSENEALLRFLDGMTLLKSFSFP